MILRNWFMRKLSEADLKGLERLSSEPLELKGYHSVGELVITSTMRNSDGAVISLPGEEDISQRDFSVDNFNKRSFLVGAEDWMEKNDYYLAEVKYGGAFLFLPAEISGILYTKNNRNQNSSSASAGGLVTALDSS